MTRLNGNVWRRVLALAAVALCTIGVRVGRTALPFAEKIAPDRGTAGRLTTINGTDLRGSPLEVRWGTASGVNPVTPGQSSREIHVSVPPRNAGDPSPDPANPSWVTVTVRVGGVTADTPPEGLVFKYPPEPVSAEPVVNPVSLTVQRLGELPIITFTGSNLTTSQGRVPSRVSAVNPANSTVQAVLYPDPLVPNPPTPTSFQALFTEPFNADAGTV